MEQEAVPAQPAAPTVTPPAAAPAPPALAVPAALTPDTVRAIAPHAGNAAISRMLVAREPAAATAPSAQAPAAGPPPGLALPGGIPLALPKGPGRIVANPSSPAIKSIDKRFYVPIPVGPLQGEIGGTLNGLARYGNGGLNVDWTRPEAAVTDPLAVKDTITVHGGLGASGTVAGGLYASIGLGNRLIAGTRVSASGTLAATGTGSLAVNGTVTRDGAQGQWTGDLGWQLSATGSLTAAAVASFEWNLLWLEGHRELFRLESFPLATITVTLGGRLKPDGTVVTTERDFKLETGAAAPARKISSTPAPGGGQAAQVAPKRRDAGAPPEDPGSVLARTPDDQAAAAPAAPATAAPQQRPPHAIAGPPAGGDVAVSEPVPGPEPEGVEP